MMYAILFFLFITLGLFYIRLRAKQKTMVIMYTRLSDRLNAQLVVALCLIASKYNQKTSHQTQSVFALLRKIKALQMLGVHAIDQRTESYDAMRVLLQELNEQQYHPDGAYPVQAFLDFDKGHIQQKNARACYNQAALGYNDCQRHALQHWLANRIGHNMVPPC